MKQLLQGLRIHEQAFWGRSLSKRPQWAGVRKLECAKPCHLMNLLGANPYRYASFKKKPLETNCLRDTSSKGKIYEAILCRGMSGAKCSERPYGIPHLKRNVIEVGKCVGSAMEVRLRDSCPRCFLHSRRLYTHRCCASRGSPSTAHSYIPLPCLDRHKRRC